MVVETTHQLCDGRRKQRLSRRRWIAGALIVFGLIAITATVWGAFRIRTVAESRSRIEEAGGTLQFRANWPVQHTLLESLTGTLGLGTGTVDLWEDFGPGAVKISKSAVLAALDAAADPGNVTVWRIHVRAFDDSCVLQLPNRDNITSLCVTEPAITDAGLQHLQSLPELQTLRLTMADISDAGLTHLAQLPRLACLKLSKTLVTDRGMETLAQFPNLNWVDIVSTSVGNTGVKTLLTSPTIRRIDVTQTDVTWDAVNDLRPRFPDVDFTITKYQGMRPDELTSSSSATQVHDGVVNE